ncbi:MAG: VOC family protein [Verrucomicrobia bacterium]|nr:VOC family protein [Verrucomicrobiota bacterium]
MKITASTLSLNVPDVAVSSRFLVEHFGFRQNHADAEGNYASLSHPETALSVVFVRCGCEVLPPGFRDERVAGTILAFTVDDLESEERRLRAAGVRFVLPIREEPWGERLFLVADPNGVLIEVLTWGAPTALP